MKCCAEDDLKSKVIVALYILFYTLSEKLWGFFGKRVVWALSGFVFSATALTSDRGSAKRGVSKRRKLVRSGYSSANPICLHLYLGSCSNHISQDTQTCFAMHRFNNYSYDCIVLVFNLTDSYYKEWHYICQEMLHYHIHSAAYKSKT